MVEASFCVPAGIGDYSWIHSKIRHLKEMADLDVTIYAPDMKPNRVDAFVRLLPDVKWGGYVDRPPEEVLLQSLPSEWPVLWLWEVLWKIPLANLAANGHVEMGKPISEWLPYLPTDYHYPIDVSEYETFAHVLMPEPMPCALVTSRAAMKDWKWRLWTIDEWADYLAEALGIAGCKEIMLMGAPYDIDETTAVGRRLEKWGVCVDYCLGRPLGLALAMLKRARYFFGMNSGISILANVLNVPAFSILPIHLRGLEESYADPDDLRTGRYKCMTKPKVEQALNWFDTVGKAHFR